MFNILKRRYATKEELEAIKKVYSIVAERDKFLEYLNLAFEKLESLTEENELLKKDKLHLESLLLKKMQKATSSKRKQLSRTK